MAILIDNYDSFTYNLVQYLGDLNQTVDVYRNDAVTCNDILSKSPEYIVISPGPATPDDAGICLELIKAAAENNIPLLGICLGHQAIGQVFGGIVSRAPVPVHGKVWKMHHNRSGVFKGLPTPTAFTRYHSLIIEEKDFPPTLDITARSDHDNLIMGVCHKSKPIYGVQFHPESIASDHGKKLLENFLNITKEFPR